MSHKNLMGNIVWFIWIFLALILMKACTESKLSLKRDYWCHKFEGEIQIAATPDGERIVVGCEPAKTYHTVWLFDSKGNVIWRIKLGEGERLGKVGISPAGKHIFFDYFVDPGIVEPTKSIKYKGGLRCIDERGKELWEKQSESTCIGYPVGSPFGSVHYVSNKLVLLAEYWWEVIQGWKLMDFDGRVLCEKRDPDGYVAENVYLSPDNSYILLSDNDKVVCLDIYGKERWRIPGSLFEDELNSSISEDGEFILLRVGVGAFSFTPRVERQGLRDVEQDIEGLALSTRDGKIVWGHAKVAWYLPPFPRLFMGTFDNFILVRGQLGKSKDALVILYELGGERSLYMIPLTCQLNREFVRSIPLPHRNSIKERTLLSKDGSRVVILSEVGEKANRTKDLKVQLFNTEGVLLRELVIEKFGALVPNQMAISSNGQRLIVVIANCLHLIDLY